MLMVISSSSLGTPVLVPNKGPTIVKRRRSEDSVVKSFSIEIVCVVFVLFSDNTRAFLQDC